MGEDSRRQDVVVTDVHMPFGSMVVFMVKWAIASIPAALILFVVGFVCWTFLWGVLLGAMHAVTPVTPVSTTLPPTQATRPAAAYDAMVTRDYSDCKHVCESQGRGDECLQTCAQLYPQH